MSVTKVEKEVYPLTDIYWGGGARVLPLVVHQNNRPDRCPRDAITRTDRVGDRVTS